jgi:hypothetical protein
MGRSAMRPFGDEYRHPKAFFLHAAHAFPHYGPSLSGTKSALNRAGMTHKLLILFTVFLTSQGLWARQPPLVDDKAEQSPTDRRGEFGDPCTEILTSEQKFHRQLRRLKEVSPEKQLIFVDLDRTAGRYMDESGTWVVFDGFMDFLKAVRAKAHLVLLTANTREHMLKFFAAVPEAEKYFILTAAANEFAPDKAALTLEFDAWLIDDEFAADNGRFNPGNQILRDMGVGFYAGSRNGTTGSNGTDWHAIRRSVLERLNGTGDAQR